MNVVFVCTGNTCRSPMCEGALKKIIAEKNIDNVECSSVGINASPGDPASNDAVIVCKEFGIDISKHRSRSIFSINIDTVDLFVAVTKSHADLIKRITDNKKEIYTMQDVSDPFMQGIDAYRKCFIKLNTEVNLVWNYIEKKLKLPL